MKGKGNTFSGSTGREPTNVTRFLNRYGHYRIRRIFVGRELSTDESRINLFFQIECDNPEDNTRINVLLYRANKVRIEIGYKPRDLSNPVQRNFTADDLNSFVRYRATRETWLPNADIDINDYEYIMDRLKAHNMHLNAPNLINFMLQALDLNEDGQVSQYSIPIRDGIPVNTQNIRYDPNYTADVDLEGEGRMYSIDDIAKYKAGSGYGDWIANLNAIGRTQNGSGNTNTRIHPSEEPPIIRNYGDQRIQEIRILRNRNRTEFMLTLTINDGTIFGDKHIIIQKDTDRPLEFAIDTDRPRLSSEFRVYNDNEALTVRQFLTSGYQNHSIGTMQQYIEERFLANNMMTRDIAIFIKDRGPRVVDGQPFSYLADVEGSGLVDWVDNHLANMYKFQNAVGIDGLFGSGYDEWQRNLKKVRSSKLRGGSYESVLNEYGDKTIERLFLTKLGSLFFILIKTDSNDILLSFDRHPELEVKARSSDNFSENRIEIHLKKPLTLRKFMTEHSKNDNIFKSSYDYVFDRIFSNNLITSLDISDFLTVPSSYYNYDSPDDPELLSPD